MATYPSILAWRIPMDRGAWWATVQGVTELDMTEQLTQYSLYSQRKNSCHKILKQGLILIVQWLRLHTSSAGDRGLIPDWGTKILHTVQWDKKIKTIF